MVKNKMITVKIKKKTAKSMKNRSMSQKLLMN